MPGQTAVAANRDQRELVVERTFNAPRALVFRAYTEPEHLKRWFGPTGWTLPSCSIDLRPGGTWTYCMRGPNGEQSCGVATYSEIVPPERLVYTDMFTDADGNRIPGLPQMHVTIELTERDGKTTLTNRTIFESLDDLDKVLAMGAVKGWGETLDRLDAELAAMVVA